MSCASHTAVYFQHRPRPLRFLRPNPVASQELAQRHRGPGRLPPALANEGRQIERVDPPSHVAAEHPTKITTVYGRSRTILVPLVDPYPRVITALRPLPHEHSTPPQAQPLTSDIIKVPSAEELKKGAKIEVIKPEEAARQAEEAAKAASNNPAKKP